MATSQEILEKQLFIAADANGVPTETLRRLLALESNHQNLHGWGARPALRRAIAAIIEEEIAASGAG